MTPSELINDWLDDASSSPAVGMQGLSLEEARQILRARDPLLTVDVPSGSFEEALRAFRPFVEALIDRLIRLEHLTISDTLQDMVDLGLYNPRLSEMFEKLWSARFVHAEKQDPREILAQLVQQTFDEGTAALRCDLLLFWLTLMGQNYEVTPGKLTLIIRGPEDKAMALLLLILSETWHPRGCPLRAVIVS